jgi:hypothetical protein
MKLIASGLVAGLLAVVAPATALAGPTVSLRVEGASGTLLPRVGFTLPDTPTAPGCAADSASAAVQVGTNGNWDQAQFVNTILGERHDLTNNGDYWATWIGRAGAFTYATEGICTLRVRTGDEVLMVADKFDPQTFGTTANPLGIAGVPATVTAGTPVIVTVTEYKADGNATTTSAPAAGATVSGDGLTAVTGADGKATLTPTAPGTFAVRATRTGNVVSDAEALVATAPAPADGGGAGPAPAPTPTPAAPVRDRTAPTTTLRGLRMSQIFRTKKAPRRLSGAVGADPSGLLEVKLRIEQKIGSRCAYYSGSRERFKRTKRCGTAYWFKIGTNASWSYLLPQKLPKGRYVIEAAAIDRAYNRSETRVVIRVK